MIKLKYLKLFLVPLSFFLFISISCGDGIIPEIPSTGDKLYYYIRNMTFTMVRVDGNIIFPTGTADITTAAIDNSFLIGETEVTYELWTEVYLWANNNGYVFTGAGGRGGYNNTATTYSSGHENNPVTYINWRDVIVWCNALTEYYNEQENSDLDCVYVYNSAVIRNAGDTDACDNASQIPDAGGFRLPTMDEWELAARYRDTDRTNTVFSFTVPYFTKGDSASGAVTDSSDKDATEEVAWYINNSGASTHAVKNKKANTLGLFDMSGNVSEWCFDLSNPGNSIFRIIKGGHWNSTNTYLQIGYRNNDMQPDTTLSTLGFRIAQNK